MNQNKDGVESLPSHRQFRAYDEILSLEEAQQLISVETTGKFAGRCTINPEWLKNQYVDNLKSSESIARMLHNLCTGATVAKNLKRFGITRTSEQQQAARRLVANQVATELQRVQGVSNVSQLEEIKQKKQATTLKHYGVPFGAQCTEVRTKMQNTCLSKYGTPYGGTTPEALQKKRDTCMQKYGVPDIHQSQEWQAQRRGMSLDEWMAYRNTKKPFQTLTPDEKQQRQRDSLERHLQIYGSTRHDAPLKLERERETCMQKYGVPYPCMTKQARARSSNNSRPNQIFESLLKNFQISYEREFVVDDRSYDFKVKDVLVEIDPSATHNCTWEDRTSVQGDRFYHQKKSKLAASRGYRCIHVWDWDDLELVASQLLSKQVVYARSCTLVELSREEADHFLTSYHLQGTCKGASVRLGLLYEGELIEVMTFGKPRYNKKYQWELLRLCTKVRWSVVGGTQKLFKSFERKAAPTSIVSYCDKSKFEGAVYKQLGFQLLRQGAPSRHWYRAATEQHITDNLLRAQGADRLVGTSLGRGTSNAQILRDNGFVEVYDCGQDSWEWINLEYYNGSMEKGSEG